jgi:hypothetical protein
MNRRKELGTDSGARCGDDEREVQRPMKTVPYPWKPGS